jgi:glycosyltransferase involved in cell wall biosynthesis
MTPQTPISVLIAIHNNEKTLGRCFQSLADQKYQDFNIVCIDDASTDQSLLFVKKWQEFFEDRLQIVENEANLGLTKSLNRGLKKITTPYTARLDGDDWWHPEKLDLQYKFLQKHPEIGLLGTAYSNIFHNRKEKSVFPPTESKVIKKSIFGYNPFAHSTVIFNTSLVQSLNGYDENVYYGQDYDLWLRLLPLTNFANLPQILCYRTADSGISQKRQNEQMKQYMKTQWKYLRKYQYSKIHYLNFIRPSLVLVTPHWVRHLRRKFL